MPLTANRELTYYASPELVEVGVDDNIVIYKGALVGRNRATGYARGLAAGDEFLGVAYRKADNTVAGHVPGGVSVMLHQNVDIVHALNGVAQADIGKDVYASDDQTLTLSPTGNSRVGRVVGVEKTNTARVRCEPLFGLGGALENAPIVTLADANVTLTLDHMNRVLLMGNTGARTVTLPPAATARAGAWFRLVKTTAAALAITIDPSGSELIDGGASFGGVDAQFDSVLVVCTGTDWIILSRDLA